MELFFVYILFSENHNRYYIGQTNNIVNRLERHNKGYEKSTSPYIPWQLIGTITKYSRSEAVILEKKLKNLNSDDLKKFILKYINVGREA